MAGSGAGPLRGILSGMGDSASPGERSINLRAGALELENAEGGAQWALRAGALVRAIAEAEAGGDPRRFLDGAFEGQARDHLASGLDAYKDRCRSFGVRACGDLLRRLADTCEPYINTRLLDRSIRDVAEGYRRCRR